MKNIVVLLEPIMTIIFIIVMTALLINLKDDVEQLKKENMILREQYIFIYDYLWED